MLSLFRKSCGSQKSPTTFIAEVYIKYIALRRESVVALHKEPVVKGPKTNATLEHNNAISVSMIAQLHSYMKVKLHTYKQRIVILVKVRKWNRYRHRPGAFVVVFW